MKFRLNPNDDWLVRVLFKHLPEHREAILALNGKPLSVEVRRANTRRTLDQNARYWKIVTALADFIGDTKAGVHEDILCEFHGYDIVTNPWTGVAKRKPKGRSHDQQITDFSALMDIADRWCAEAGVSWEQT